MGLLLKTLKSLTDSKVLNSIYVCSVSYNYNCIFSELLNPAFHGTHKCNTEDHILSQFKSSLFLFNFPEVLFVSLYQINNISRYF